jgi:DnaK suppressor protein
MKTDPGSGLTEQQTAQLRTQLENARRQLLERTRQRRPRSDGDPLAQGEPTGDPADQAELTFEQSVTVELNEADRRRLREIADALTRMDEGRYGICEGTGEPIGFKRLSTTPWARYTSEYQQLLEEEARLHRPTL